MVVRPTKSDLDLLRLQLQVMRKCDAFAIYSNTSDFSTPFGEDNDVRLSPSGSTKKQQQGGIEVPPGLKGRSMDVPYGHFKNALNTPIFLPVFRHAFGFVAAANAAANATTTNAATANAATANAATAIKVAAEANATARATVLHNLAAPSSPPPLPSLPSPSFDWAVKLDVDTVLAVDRLRAVLSQHDPAKAQVLCNKPLWRGPPGFGHPTCLDGPLEVVSAAAAELYASKAKEACEAKIIDDSSTHDPATGWDSSFVRDQGMPPPPSPPPAPPATTSSVPLLPRSPSSSSPLTFDVGRMSEDWYLDSCFAEALIPSWISSPSDETTDNGRKAGHPDKTKHESSTTPLTAQEMARPSAAATAVSTAAASLPRAPSVIEPRLLVNSHPLWPLRGNVTAARQLDEWEQKNTEMQRRQASRNLEWCRGPHRRGSKAALHPVKDPGELARCLALLLSNSS
jgi:hypothetical protein